MNNLFMGQVFALRFDVRSNRVNERGVLEQELETKADIFWQILLPIFLFTIVYLVGSFLLLKANILNIIID